VTEPTRQHRAEADGALVAWKDGRDLPEFVLDDLARHLAAQIAHAEERGRERGVRPFRDLFSGGPDTSCRTAWRREGGYGGRDTVTTECVEVPLDDLRAAFDEAGEQS